jgi:hypothetical protein
MFQLANGLMGNTLVRVGATYLLLIITLREMDGLFFSGDICGMVKG